MKYSEAADIIRFRTECEESDSTFCNRDCEHCEVRALMGTHEEYLKAKSIAIDLLRNSEWIPVCERCPEEHEWSRDGLTFVDPSSPVLVQLTGGRMKISRYWSHYRSSLIKTDWIDLDEFDGSQVMAWMPLPKPL